MTDAELLSEAIKATGLSVRRFGRLHFPLSHERTIWRWLAGEPEKLPRKVREHLEAVLQSATAQRETG